MAVLVTMAVFTLLAAKREPEYLKVMVTPKLCLSPCEVTVRVSVLQGDPRWTCPRVLILWPDGTKSDVESDCDPADPDFTAFTRTTWLGPGVHEIQVLFMQGKASHIEWRTVEVK